MQALASAVLNRKHPDARGCRIALPFVWDCGGASVTIRESTGRNRWTSNAVGNIRAKMQSGNGLDLGHGTTTDDVRATDKFFTSDWSFCARVTLLPLGGASNWTIFASGAGGNGPTAYVIGPAPGTLKIYNGAPTLYITGPATVVGQEMFVGVRYDSVSTVYSFFINGLKTTGSFSSAWTPTSGLFTIGTDAGGGNNALDGGPIQIRDFRWWNRLMPDATYERAYTRPNDFYVRGAFSGLRIVGFNASRFFPFLHPALRT